MSVQLIDLKAKLFLIGRPPCAIPHSDCVAAWQAWLGPESNWLSRKHSLRGCIFPADCKLPRRRLQLTTWPAHFQVLNLVNGREISALEPKPVTMIQQWHKIHTDVPF